MLQRLILEMGTGNDLHGEDYTKAAIRGVQDAMHHSSLTLFRALDLDPNAMVITVTVGVQAPERVDGAGVAAALPYGSVTVRPVHGGLNVVDEANGVTTVIAAVAIEALYPIEPGRYRLAPGFAASAATSG